VQKGLVGELLYRGLKADGQEMDISDYDSRVMNVRPDELKALLRGKSGLDLQRVQEFLKPLDDEEREEREEKLKSEPKLREVVVVAGGKHKAKVINAVCKQGYISILVTDEEAAREILKIAR